MAPETNSSFQRETHGTQKKKKKKIFFTREQTASITKLNKLAFVLTTLSCVSSPQSANIPNAHFTSLSALTG